MERRKVIKHGPSTHIISLPAEWVKKNNVDKGDELTVKQNGWELLVSTKVRAPVMSIKHDLSDLPPFLITRLLARSYQKGYDKIKIIHKDPKKLQAIKDKVQDLMGFEIIEQDDWGCLIKSVTRNLELDFENSLRKAFLIVKQMIENCIEHCIACEEDRLRNVKLKDMEVNRFTYFCLRQINKERHADPDLRNQSHVLYYLVEVLEDMGDSCVELSGILAETLPVADSVIKLMKKILKQYELSYEYFYNPKAEKATEAFELYNQILEDFNDACGKSPSKEEIMAIATLKSMAEMTYHFTTMRLDFLGEKD